MIDNYINQAIRLSPGQAVLMLCLALAAVGLAFVVKGMNDNV